jgi:hypothetical protein
LIDAYRAKERLWRIGIGFVEGIVYSMTAIIEQLERIA